MFPIGGLEVLICSTNYMWRLFWGGARSFSRFYMLRKSFGCRKDLSLYGEIMGCEDFTAIILGIVGRFGGYSVILQHNGQASW